MLPSIDKLLELEDLAHLSDNATFKYLLKIGYEYYVARPL